MGGRARMATVAVIALLAAMVVTAPARAAVTTERVAGVDRYETAVAVSVESFPSGADAVLVASGEAFPDALAAAPAAAVLGAPVLFVPACCAVPDSTASELDRLDPSRIYILGGTAAVSATTEDALGAHAAVTRIAGVDRYETAAAISAAFFDDADDVFLAPGDSFGEVLAVGGLAGALGAPILLQAPGRGLVIPELRRLAPDRVYATTSTDLDPETTDAVADVLASIERLGVDDDLVGLAADVAREGAVRGAFAGPTAYLVTADRYPDALAAGALAARRGAALLLASGSCAGAELVAVVEELDITALVVVGGTAAVPAAVARLAPCPGDEDPVDEGPRTVAELEAAIEADIYRRINAERASRGIDELEWDDDLGALAKDWSETMADEDIFEHRALGEVFEDPDFSDRIQIFGENISYRYGQVDAVQSVHLGLMNADGHRRNILQTAYDIVGIGAECRSDGRLFVTQDFAGRVGFNGEYLDEAPPVGTIVADEPDGLHCPGP